MHPVGPERPPRLPAGAHPGIEPARRNLSVSKPTIERSPVQAGGFTDDVLTLEPLVDKWRAFNWEVLEMDGHDWDDIYNTINKAKEVKGKPTMIIAHTVKAKDCSIMENRPESHNIKVTCEADREKYMSALKLSDYQLPY